MFECIKENRKCNERTVKSIALFLVLSSYFITAIDGSIVITGLKRIAEDLQLSSVSLSWVQNAYVLVFGGFMLLGGRLGDTLGRKRMFNLSLMLFGFGSLGAGVAPSAGIMIAARFVQGVGAAVMAPAALALIMDYFEGEKRTKAVAWYGSISGIGLCFGLIGYYPQHSRSYYSIQPRLSVKYFPSEKNLLYVNFSKMEQFYHFLRFDSFALPTDFRMPSIDGFKPRSSEHYEVGWKHFLEGGQLELSAFYKTRRNVLALRPDTWLEGEEWSQYLMTGKGESYGVKGYFYQRWKRWNLQLSYAYSRSKEWFGEMPERGKMPSLYDVPHQLAGAVSYQWTKRSSLSVGGCCVQERSCSWMRISSCCLLENSGKDGSRSGIGWMWDTPTGNRSVKNCFCCVWESIIWWEILRKRTS